MWPDATGASCGTLRRGQLRRGQLAARLGGSMRVKRVFTLGTALGLGGIVLTASAALAYGVTGWVTPSMATKVQINYGATVDTSCGGGYVVCEHHLSLERDSGIGWRTVAYSIVPMGNGAYKVVCDTNGTYDYKSHFHLDATGWDGRLYQEKADSSAARLTCDLKPDPNDPVPIDPI